MSAVAENDGIEAAVAAGDKAEAIRLMLCVGVWAPYRERSTKEDGSLDVKFYDTPDCFPVFSSTEKVVAFLRSKGALSKPGSVPAMKFGAEHLVSNGHLCGVIVLNPGSRYAWRFTEPDFRSIAEAKQNAG